jgi:hypothetical protein
LDVNGTVRAKQQVYVGRASDNAVIGSLKEGPSNSVVLESEAGGSDSVIYLKTGAADRVIVNSSGNVGIGTTSPAKRLSVIAPNDDVTTFAGFYAANGTQGTEIWYGGIQMGGSSSNVNLSLASKGTSHIALITNGTERARIDSDGLKFNGDTAAANALDDYEEGDWTPSYTRSDPSGFTYTAGANDAGTYTKIGRQVFVKCIIDGTFSGGAGAFRLQTLPVAPAGGATSYFMATVGDLSAGTSGAGFTNATEIVFLDITPVSGNIVSISATYTV